MTHNHSQGQSLPDQLWRGADLGCCTGGAQALAAPPAAASRAPGQPARVGPPVSPAREMAKTNATCGRGADDLHYWTGCAEVHIGPERPSQRKPRGGGCAGSIRLIKLAIGLV